MRSIVRVIAVAGALAFASCSGPEERAGRPAESGMEADLASPDISPSAAPGVSFRYGYDFQLADDRIAEVQEAHASSCERLGLSRCRITGMRFTIDEREQVTAMLQVKLDPRIARQFGKAAVETVEDSGGKLVNAEFTGEDEGPTLRQASTRQEELEAQIAEIERRLASLGEGDRERVLLQQQLTQLRNELSQVRSTATESEERLASTPMTFHYYGEGGVPGFGGRNPVEEGWHAFLASGVALISVVLYLVGALLPWLVLLLLIVLLVRSRAGHAVLRWWRTSSYRKDEASEVEDQQT